MCKKYITCINFHPIPDTITPLIMYERRIMTIELYRSLLCPRCAYAAHILKNLQKEFDDIEVIHYDIITDFNTFRQEGITMIPTIKIDKDRESWVFPSESQIRDFVVKRM